MAASSSAFRTAEPSERGASRTVAAADSVPARRDSTLDVVRGLIVALMALDHVRMFVSSAQFDPVDLDHTNLAYFLTRWVTHLCAPGFFFIAGLGAGLFEGQAGRAATAKLLLGRGALLVVLEVLVFGLAWSFNPGWWWFGVIAGLGASMMAMAALIHLPRLSLAVVAGLFTLLHNSLWPAGAGGAADALLHSGGLVSLPFAGERLALYPLLPWLALMMLGYAATPILERTDRRSSAHLFWAGLGMVAAFVAARFAGFGEPPNGGFEAGSHGARALMSFLNVEKYPPSLQFSLATLGVLVTILAVVRLDAARLLGTRAARVLETYGRVPFFFYLLHLFLIHAAALAAAALLGWPTAYLFWTGSGPNLLPPDGYGLPLAGVLVAWVAVLALLYPLCAWYGALKRTRPSWILKLL
jgi:uncharacterized membrane protein